MPNGEKPKSIQKEEREEIKMGRLSRENVQALVLVGEKDFSNEDLKDLDLSGLKLDGATFDGADVRGTSFYNPERSPAAASLVRTTWTDAVFPDQNKEYSFVGCDLSGALFRSTGQSRLNLSTIDYGDAILVGSQWLGVYFGEMDYYNSIFEGGYFN